MGGYLVYKGKSANNFHDSIKDLKERNPLFISKFIGIAIKWFIFEIYLDIIIQTDIFVTMLLLFIYFS